MHSYGTIVIVTEIDPICTLQAVYKAYTNHPVFIDVPDVFSVGIVSHAVVFYDSGFGLLYWCVVDFHLKAHSVLQAEPVEWRKAKSGG